MPTYLFSYFIPERAFFGSASIVLTKVFKPEMVKEIEDTLRETAMTHDPFIEPDHTVVIISIYRYEEKKENVPAH